MLVGMAQTAEDLTGQRFGRWVVERKSKVTGEWMARCECELLFSVPAHNLLTGASRGCRYCHRARVNAT